LCPVCEVHSLPNLFPLNSWSVARQTEQTDKQLLSQARTMGKGEKLSPDQYQALRRKIGGTAKDYWKDWVEVEGQYVDKGYVDRSNKGVSSNAPIIAIGGGLVLGMAAFVVTQL